MKNKLLYLGGSYVWVTLWVQKGTNVCYCGKHSSHMKTNTDRNEFTIKRDVNMLDQNWVG